MTTVAGTSVPAAPLDRFGALRQQRRRPRSTPRTRRRSRRPREDFEAFFVTHAFEDMFADLSSDPLFGGGEGEDIFKSFLLQEYGKQVAKTGGIGISDMVQKQLLQLQETPK